MAYGMKTKDCHFPLSLAKTSCRSRDAPAVFWPVVDLSCWAWQALPHHGFLMNQSFQNDSCILLCFIFRDNVFDIAFVLTHLLDSLVMYNLTELAFLCRFDSFLKRSELLP